ncbi:MAG: hydrogenase maturation protease [Bacteroidota bacterium]|nr:MAG: hydrogenase maturation protease [Bacteroidota bacterium]
MKKILVYGYGNPGRQDDGLGILLAEHIEDWAKKHQYNSVFTDTNYQLNIEDAYDLNQFDIVIYADASLEEVDQFKLEILEPNMNAGFSMHAVSPGYILGLCQSIYESIPKAYLLHIKGYEWEFMAGLSTQAKENLHKACLFMEKTISGYLTN